MEKKERRIKLVALIFSGIVIILILIIPSFLISKILDNIVGLPGFLPYYLNLIIGLIFMIFGIFFGAWSNYTLFKLGQGSPIPTKYTHTNKLVTEGPYKYSRNPMIFGTILIWIGLGFLFNSIFFITLFTTIIIISLYLVVRFWEEKNLEKRFGNEYLEYKKNVSMIIPLPPKKEIKNFSTITN